MVIHSAPKNGRAVDTEGSSFPHGVSYSVKCRTQRQERFIQTRLGENGLVFLVVVLPKPVLKNVVIKSKPTCRAKRILAKRVR